MRHVCENRNENRALHYASGFYGFDCMDFYFCALYPSLGEPMYEVIKNIPANTELIVHYLPERPEEIFFMPAVHYLRNTLYRRTMDTILEGKSLARHS